MRAIHIWQPEVHVVSLFVAGDQDLSFQVWGSLG
jgi:hypothetical protein